MRVRVRLLTAISPAAQDSGDRRVIALNLNRKAEVLLRSGEFADALKCCEEAEAINRELGRAKGIATTLKNLCPCLVGAEP